MRLTFQSKSAEASGPAIPGKFSAGRLAGIALLAVSFFAAQPARAHHEQGKLRVAAILSLSGPNAYLGRAELRALELGVAELNAGGGVEGHVLELAAFDDQGEPVKAADFAARLTGDAHADVIIGGTSTDASIAIARLAEKLRTPFISLGAGSQILTFSRRWVFKTPPSERIVLNRILEDMARRGIRRMALLAEETEFGRGGLREIRDATNRQSVAFRKFGVALAFDATFRADGSGIANFVERVPRDAALGAVVVFGTGEGPAAVLKELRRAGAKTPVYLTHGVASAEFLAVAGEAAEGARAPSPPLLVADALPETDPRRKTVMAFASAYRARFNESPSSFAGYAWDALMMVAAAVRRSPLTDQDWIRAPLEITRVHAGVTGSYTIWPDDHLGLDEKALLMLEVRRGAWRIAE